MSFFVRAPQSTVVLLHSSASSARQWDGLADALGARFRVQAVDLHGHGSQAPWAGDSPMTLADDAALVTPLLADARGVHLVGHSYGAAVALKLASLHPQAVRSLVVYEPLMFGWLMAGAGTHGARKRPIDAVKAVAEFIADALARQDARGAAQRFVDFWSDAGTWDDMPPHRQLAIAARMAAVQRHFTALFAEPLQARPLADLSMPMQFMTGENTVSAMRYLAEAFSQRLPRAQHELLFGMGHMGPFTHAAQVNRRIERFLQRHAGHEEIRVTVAPPRRAAAVPG